MILASIMGSAPENDAPQRTESQAPIDLPNNQPNQPRDDVGLAGLYNMRRARLTALKGRRDSSASESEYQPPLEVERPSTSLLVR